MAVANVGSPADVAAALASGKPVVLHFWSSWCEPCKHMDAVMAQLAADLPGVAYMRVEAEVVDEVTMQYEVVTVPCFVFLRAGEVVDRLEGADPPALTAKATALARGGAPATTSAPASATAAAPTASASAGTVDASFPSSVFGRIKFLLSSWPVVLAMKGSADTPRCGFSGRVVEALHKLGVAFKSVDILSDDALRQGLKEYSNWPTFPQLYVKGELVGGCDIVTEMAGSGDLEALFKEKMGPDYKQAAAAAAAVADGASQPATGTAAPVAAAEPASTAAAAAPAPSSEAVRERIKALLNGPKPVMLFMKGSPAEPRCGFSRRVVEALQSENVEFGSFDILADEDIRQGLKEYGNWPTYPQLYVNGELLGGCDIVAEMKAAGELGSTVQEMLHRMDVA